MAMQSLLRVIAAIVLAVAGLASGSRMRGNRGIAPKLPYDCYLKKGADYVGLFHSSQSGRKCMNWLDSKKGEDLAGKTGIGNHAYCRNPDGSKDKPWCFTVDPKKEWEYCEVPECPDGGKPPEAWVAPKGGKSKEAEAKGPCKYKPPPKITFKKYKDGACLNNRGKTWWLITNKMKTVRSPVGCQAKCAELPGVQFFTYWKSPPKDKDIPKDLQGNCGCYRKCVLPQGKKMDSSAVVYKVL